MIYKRERFVDESFDQQAGDVLSKNVERLAPVDEDGEKLPDEDVQFFGIAEVVFQKGPFNSQVGLHFEIPAKDLRTAFKRFDRFAEEEAEEKRGQFEKEIERKIAEVRGEQRSDGGIIQPGAVSQEDLQQIKGGN